MTAGASARRTAVLTLLALCAFAANSLLCRAALGPRLIDAESFTSVRIVAGAAVLWLLVRGRGGRLGGGSWTGALALFAYAIAFSLAYLRISAGVGALVLFGCVQATMIGSALARGERLRARQWIGLALALGGLAWLLLPGASAPDPAGAALMALAGVAWGVYSLLGRGSQRPLASTAQNFVLSVPFALAASAIGWSARSVSGPGLLLAATSGAITSGVGYAIWYAALPTLGTARAAVAQLAVPVIAGAGGVLLLGEIASARFLASGVLVLVGVALAVVPYPLRVRHPGARMDTGAEL